VAGRDNHGRTDPTGRDLLRAAPPARRHTAVLRAHLLAGVQTGARTYQEVEGLFPAWGLSQVAAKDRRADYGELRRMDMVLEQDMQLIYADPTLVDGLTAGDVEARTRNAEAPRAVVAAEADKVKYYGPDVPAGTFFFACGYDTLTGCGKGAKEFQHLLAVRTSWRANEGNPPSAHLVDIRQRIRHQGARHPPADRHRCHACLCGLGHHAVRQEPARSADGKETLQERVCSRAAAAAPRRRFGVLG
jgi:hypothetical protein